MRALVPNFSPLVMTSAPGLSIGGHPDGTVVWQANWSRLESCVRDVRSGWTSNYIPSALARNNGPQDSGCQHLGEGCDVIHARCVHHSDSALRQRFGGSSPSIISHAAWFLLSATARRTEAWTMVEITPRARLGW
ncbi:hypothetical protein GE21DRAFT_1343417 [Neurospora crassa]|nr:hypothetical protein GE21DRAFT_1343417 [Neurospora crassa]